LLGSTKRCAQPDYHDDRANADSCSGHAFSFLVAWPWQAAGHREGRSRVVEKQREASLIV